jgi:hypothetical protein
MSSAISHQLGSEATCRDCTVTVQADTSLSGPQVSASLTDTIRSLVRVQRGSCGSKVLLVLFDLGGEAGCHPAGQCQNPCLGNSVGLHREDRKMGCQWGRRQHQLGLPQKGAPLLWGNTETLMGTRALKLRQALERCWTRGSHLRGRPSVWW